MDNPTAEEQSHSLNTDKTSAAFHLTKQILEQIYQDNPAPAESRESAAQAIPGGFSSIKSGQNEDIKQMVAVGSQLKVDNNYLTMAAGHLTSS